MYKCATPMKLHIAAASPAQKIFLLINFIPFVFPKEEGNGSGQLIIYFFLLSNMIKLAFAFSWKEETIIENIIIRKLPRNNLLHFLPPRRRD